MTLALNALSQARAQLMIDFPFFGVLALRLLLEEDKSIPTLAVDGRTIFYNPDYVLALEPKYRVTAMAHEVTHCALGHVERVAGRNHKKWNRACDYAENPILREAGLPLHPSWLYEQRFTGMLADDIYPLLSGESGDGQCEIRPGPPGVSNKELKAEWELATVQAAKVAGRHGNTPAQFRKIVEDIISPKIPWEHELAMYFTERVKNDYSWRRPNPYFADQFYLPQLDGMGMGEVVIVIDTSGSVWSILDSFSAVVRDILISTNPRRTVVIYCDAQINRVDTFNQGEPLTMEHVGGGGTDFRPPFQYLEKHGINPACFLYLTDMYGSFPSKAPPYPVLWCATTDRTAPFGRVLRIGE